MVPLVVSLVQSWKARSSGTRKLSACGDGLGGPKARNGAILEGESRDSSTAGLEVWRLRLDVAALEKCIMEVYLNCVFNTSSNTLDA